MKNLLIFPASPITYKNPKKVTKILFFSINRFKKIESCFENFLSVFLNSEIATNQQLKKAPNLTLSPTFE